MIDLFITLDIKDETTDEELYDLAKNLAGDLSTVNAIESVELVRTRHLEEGAMGSSIEAGQLLAKIAETGGFTSLVSVMSSFLGRDRSRSLKLQIGDKSLEVTGLSKSEQTALIEWFQIQAGLRFEK